MADDSATPRGKDASINARGIASRARRSIFGSKNRVYGGQEQVYGETSGFGLYLILGILITSLALTSAWLLLNCDWNQTIPLRHAVAGPAHQSHHCLRLQKTN